MFIYLFYRTSLESAHHACAYPSLPTGYGNSESRSTAAQKSGSGPQTKRASRAEARFITEKKYSLLWKLQIGANGKRYSIFIHSMNMMRVTAETLESCTNHSPPD